MLLHNISTLLTTSSGGGSLSTLPCTYAITIGNTSLCVIDHCSNPLTIVVVNTDFPSMHHNGKNLIHWYTGISFKSTFSVKRCGQVKYLNVNA